MPKETRSKQYKYLFLLNGNTPEAAKVATDYLREVGAKILERHGDVAMVALASEEQVDAAYQSKLFSAITRGAMKREHIEKLDTEQKDIASLWSYIHSRKYNRIRKDVEQRGKSWSDPKFEAPGPQTLVSPEDFKEALKEKLGIDEKELRAKYKKRKRKPVRLTGKSFVDYERKLEKAYKDPTIAYHLARVAWHLEPIYYEVLLKLPLDFIRVFLVELACWEMRGEISVGVVFVESSSSSGPRFTSSERNTLRARISDGLSWLASEAPTNAQLTWVYDWQFVKINVANGNNSSNESYWRDPAMGQVTYNGNTYSQTWGAVADYREDMRQRNWSQHAIVIFVTPYGNSWHAYASGGRVTLAERNNWGGWGINTVDEITAHEACHLFGAADEYTGSGTPCSSCGTVHGCDSIPNGNCGACASPLQDCVMDGNSPRLCAYTQGQIGWADLFVELTTADVMWAGTDDTVWLDIGDRTFELDTSNHNDRERNNVEGYAIVAPGLNQSDIKRVGIRKSSDGFAGGWKLERVRLWHQGTLVCDANNINQWLEDEYLWWASTSCGASSTIVNKLRVKVTTANVGWAGTDDDVRIYLGGRSWNLDNPDRNDFERGNTDTFDLDPGTGLYQSMISSIRIHKSPDGIAGGWKLKGLQIYVNGSRIYNNQSINKWLEDSDRDWYGTV